MEQRVKPQHVEQILAQAGGYNNRIVATTTEHAMTDTFFVRQLDRRTTTDHDNQTIT